ncbi:MAG: hypothetical protein ACPL3P_04225 [Anaerolineales bacterium]
MKIIQAIPNIEGRDSQGKSKINLPQISKNKRPLLDSPVLSAFNQILNDEFYLIKNSTCIDATKELPPLIIGPLGVIIVLENNSHGVYRAREMFWEKLNETKNQYHPETPNPILFAAEWEQRVAEFLAKNGFAQVPVQPIIVFTNPGIHLELDEPAVRLLPMDGLGRFLVSLGQEIPKINLGDIPQLVKLFAPLTSDDEKKVELQDDFSLIEEKPKKPVKLPDITVALPKDEKFIKTVNKVPFTTRQLILLAVLVIVNIIILIGLVLVVLSYHY